MTANDGASIRKILAIDPGTREMGVAVLAGIELEYYGVKTITDRKSPSSILLQGSQIVFGLIGLYKPGVLAIERPFMGYGNRSATLVSLEREIVKLGASLGIEVREIGPKRMKKIVAGSGSSTKKDVAKIICSKFPELRIYFGQTHKYKDKYWQNMFDAVAVGLAASSQTTHRGQAKPSTPFKDECRSRLSF
jgi:Holliday junction resolvasome RuvABC endonuclease subunit